MSRIEFHSEVGDTLQYACRLLRKAYRQGAAVLVTGPSVILDALDRELWAFEAKSFVPHLRLRPGPRADALRARTPIWLGDAPPEPPCPGVLVNLGAEVQPDLARFDRVIEVVGSAPEELRSGRSRWRAYLAQGLKPVHRRPAASGAHG